MIALDRLDQPFRTQNEPSMERTRENNTKSKTLSVVFILVRIVIEKAVDESCGTPLSLSFLVYNELFQEVVG